MRLPDTIGGFIIAVATAVALAQSCDTQPAERAAIETSSSLVEISLGKSVVDSRHQTKENYLQNVGPALVAATVGGSAPNCGPCPITAMAFDEAWRHLIAERWPAMQPLWRVFPPVRVVVPGEQTGVIRPSALRR